MTFRRQMSAQRLVSGGALFCLLASLGCQTTKESDRPLISKSGFLRTSNPVVPNSVTAIPAPGSPALRTVENSPNGTSVTFVGQPPIGNPVPATNQHVVVQTPTATPTPNPALPPVQAARITLGDDGVRYILMDGKMVPIANDPPKTPTVQIITNQPSSVVPQSSVPVQAPNVPIIPPGPGPSVLQGVPPGPGPSMLQGVPPGPGPSAPQAVSPVPQPSVPMPNPLPLSNRNMMDDVRIPSPTMPQNSIQPTGASLPAVGSSVNPLPSLKISPELDTNKYPPGPVNAPNIPATSLDPKSFIIPDGPAPPWNYPPGK